MTCSGFKAVSTVTDEGAQRNTAVPAQSIAVE